MNSSVLQSATPLPDMYPVTCTRTQMLWPLSATIVVPWNTTDMFRDVYKSSPRCAIEAAHRFSVEKELLAVVFGCERFHQYVYGKPVKEIMRIMSI